MIFVLKQLNEIFQGKDKTFLDSSSVGVIGAFSAAAPKKKTIFF
jgi:hypothetical protein